MHCLSIPRYRVPPYLELVRPWVVSACRAGGWVTDPRKVLEGIEQRDDVLLVMLVHEGRAGGCMVVETENRARVHVLSIGADRKALPRGWYRCAVEHLVEMARTVGAASITGAGRLGWERVLAPLGFRWDGEFYRKAVEP